jgi:periplasmic protein TonB
MTDAGFFAQKQGSPSSLALVILLHAAVLAAVIMIKGPQFIIQRAPPTILESYPVDQDPPPVPPPQPRQEQPTRIDRVPTIIRTPQDPHIVTPPWTPPRPPETGTGTVITPPPPPPLPPPAIRRGAELDPRYAGELQPPYPAAEIRAQREGTVRIRVTIGADGRVKAVARVQATSDAFWAVAERQALNRWRFRPATVDGRPVEDSKVMTLHFRLVDL